MLSSVVGSRPHSVGYSTELSVTGSESHPEYCNHSLISGSVSVITGSAEATVSWSSRFTLLKTLTITTASSSLSSVSVIYVKVTARLSGECTA